MTPSDAYTESYTETIEVQRPVHRGRRPTVTYFGWHRSQLVNLGANAPDEWYWQCPKTGCKRWFGPYTNPLAAKTAGFEHVTRHAGYYR